MELNINQNFNRFFKRILGKMGYDIPIDNVNSFNILYFLFILIISVIVLIISYVGIEKFVLLTFMLHYLNIIYTCLMSNIEFKTYNEKWKTKNRFYTNVAIPRIPHTPYHGRRIALSCIVALIAFMILISVFPSVDKKTIYIIVTYMSICLNFLKNNFDALILIYHATVNIQ